jgi:hypothetical protein
LTAVLFNSSYSLQGVALAGFSLQLVVAGYIIRRSRIVSICGLFSILWLIYFPVRLAARSFGGTSMYYFPAVNSATSSQLEWMWLLTTAALTAFLAAGILTTLHPPSLVRPSVVRSALTHGDFLIAGILGEGVTVGLYVLNASSGILGNVSSLTLFGIAGASYHEQRQSDGQRRLFGSLPLMLVTLAFGYLAGQKEAALSPVAAYVVGRAGAGGAFRPRYVIASLLVVGLAFGTIQGERDAALYGRVIRNPFTALRIGLTQYDLAHGEPKHFAGIDILFNTANGVLYRLKGADYLIAIAAKVPSEVPFQEGRSIWEPALSVVHGSQSLLTLAPQYRQLSLGRYVDQTFISDDPAADASAQSPTIPGDLYLDFGSNGVIIGMFILGGLYFGFDRRYSIDNPTGTAVFAFAGLPLLAVDGNVAYILVTAGLRLAIAYLTIHVVLPRKTLPDLLHRRRLPPTSVRL